MDVSELEKIGSTAVLSNTELQNLAKIKRPDYFSKTILKKELAPYQIKLIDMGLRNPFTGFFFPRQCGKSFSCALLAIYKLLFGKNEKIYVIAPIRDQAKGDLFGAMLEMIDSSEFLQKYLVATATAIKKKKKGDSGFIKWMSASPNAKITGKTATLVIIDESQDIDDEKIEKDIYPFAAHFGAPIIQIGTARGRNHFYQIFQKESGYETLTIDHNDVPRITKEEAKYKAGYQIGYIEKQRKIMSKEAFDSQYGGKFIMDTNHAFRWKDINRCTYDLENYNSGFPNVPYYAGLDFGKSPNHTVLTLLARTGDKIAGGDGKGYYATRAWFDWENEKFTKIVGIDKATLDGHPDPDVESLYKISQRFKFAHLYIDHTGMGMPISEMFDELNEHLADKNMREIPFSNFDFSNRSKKELVDNTTVMMERGLLKFSKFFSDEMRNYIKKEIDTGWRYCHDKGFHDDRVDSLMLAAMSVREYTHEIERMKDLEIEDPELDIFEIMEEEDDESRTEKLLRKRRNKDLSFSNKEDDDECDLFAVNVGDSW